MEGFTLSKSLQEYPRSFDTLFCSTIAAGEQSGFLSEVLENLADYIERQYEAAKGVQSALTYPIVLLIFAFLMVSGLMVYVVPDMVGVIIESGQELPLATQILIRINEVVANFWWLIAGFGFSIFVCLFAMKKIYFSNLFNSLRECTLQFLLLLKLLSSPRAT